MSEFYLLSKDNCHLCTEALLMVHRSPVDEPVRLHIVDITEQPDLQDEYGLLIPVLIRAHDDAELKWPFAADTLLEFLES
ncbi:glutaredoxin family protein [Aliidiomarina sp. Khilg15.8]